MARENQPSSQVSAAAAVTNKFNDFAFLQQGTREDFEQEFKKAYQEKLPVEQRQSRFEDFYIAVYKQYQQDFREGKYTAVDQKCFVQLLINSAAIQETQHYPVIQPFLKKVKVESDVEKQLVNEANSILDFTGDVAFTQGIDGLSSLLAQVKADQALEQGRGAQG